MKNNISFYRHETGSHNHWKFKVLRKKYGWGGEGKFWALNNMIADAEGCTLELGDEGKLAAIAVDLDFEPTGLKDFIQYLLLSCKLIIEKDGGITTTIVHETFQDVSAKRHYDRDRKTQLSLRKTQVSSTENQQSKVKEITEEKSKVLGSYDPPAFPAADVPNLEKDVKEKYKLLISNIDLSSKEGQNAAVTKIKSFILEHKPAFHEPYVQYWNLFARKTKLPSVTSFNDDRKRKFKTRIKEKDFNLVEILKEANCSDTLKESRWFTWNWIFENQENYVKVLEGNYRNKPKETQPAGGVPPNLVNLQLEEIRKIRQQTQN